MPTRYALKALWLAAYIASAIAVAMALTLLTAKAQQTTIYGPNGNVVGHAVRDSQGSVTIYGAGDNVTGRTSTDSQGTTTIYDADGRKAGSVTTTTKPQRSRDQRGN
jgi:YD repeat-containing protein